MNDARFEYRYVPLGYSLYGSNNNAKNNQEEEPSNDVVNKVDEYQTNFLNLPQDFKLGG